jgi:hypothetical protein
MPVRYRAEYRSELRRRHKTWELGVHRDKAAALAAFNEMSDGPRGTFSFDGPPIKLKAMSWSNGMTPNKFPAAHFAQSICVHRELKNRIFGNGGFALRLI